jgi:hypothetical protein
VGEDETEAVDSRLNEFRAEVLLAMLADRQWGGLAVDTFYEGAEPFASSQGGAEGLRMTFQTVYRTIEGDPYDGL